MGSKVVNPFEVELNSVRYPTLGRVRPSLISQFPSKVVIGDYSKESEQVASSWVISDQRGGCLIEEMDEAIHRERFYWSTADTRFSGHIILPPLATDCGAGGILENNAIVTIDYDDEVYAIIGRRIRKFDNDNDDFNDGVIAVVAVEDCEDVWNTYQNPNCTHAVDATDKKVGTNSLKIQVDTASAGQVLCTETIGSTDLSAVNGLSLWIKSQLAAAAGDLQIVIAQDDTTWTSPTGFDDPDTKWASEIDAYDEDTNDPAECDSIPVSSWGGYLELTHAALWCNKIRYWIHSTTEAEISLIDLDAYYNGAWHDVYEGAYTEGEWITKTFTDDVQYVTKCRIRAYNSDAGDTKSFRLGELDFGEWTAEVCDIPALTADTWTEVFPTITTPANVDAVTRILLYSVTDLGTEPYIIRIDNVAGEYTLAADGTDAIVYQVSGTDKLFIAHTGGYVIWDGESFTTDSDDATFFVEWEGSLYKMDYTGQLAYGTDGTTWTNNGKLKLPDNYAKSLFLYRDAVGSVIIYAGTKRGLFAHDSTNAKFIQTELELPDHPTGGQGATKWHDAAYISAGLHIKKYTAGYTATIAFAGLDRDDGIPSEYRGEITKLIKGYTDFYALVDSSLSSGTGYSSVMAGKELGWRCLWLSSTADKAIKCGHVSTAHDEYRLFFGTDNKIYFIDLQKDIINPLKISTYTYAASAIHITPWFDGGVAWNKLALEIELFCKGIVDDAQEVVVSYRTDHSSTSIGSVGTEWTSLGTIEANGSTELSFASGVGLSFRNIQFRFDLSRGATTTLTPDIQEVKFKYLKLLPPLWGWTFKVDCSKNYKGRTGRQRIEALITAAETETLLDFVFTDTATDTVDTRKVKIKSIIGDVQSGENKKGTYSIQVIEV